MTKLKAGDIIEIATPSGWAYAQFIQKHKQYGALIKVFAGVHEDRLIACDSLVGRGEAFVCFFPLSAAVDRGIVQMVGNIAVSEESRNFPLLRDGIADPNTGKVTDWWLWDGENEWKVGALTADQRKLPIRGVWNDTLLVERIQSGWRPEKDSE